MDFIGDRTTHSLDQQYMLGPNLLFAPVFGDEGCETEYYLPAGVWTAYTPLLGKNRPRVIVGPTWVKEAVPYDEIPAFVRPNSVLPLGPANMKRPDYELDKDVEIRLYQLDVGTTTACHIPTGKGSTIAAEVEVTRTETQIITKVVNGSLSKWSIRLFQHGLQQIGSVQGATLEGSGECAEYGGFVLTAKEGEKEIAITL